MDQKSRRKQLVSEYKQTRPEAGVYRVVNSQTGVRQVHQRGDHLRLQNRSRDPPVRHRGVCAGDPRSAGDSTGDDAGGNSGRPGDVGRVVAGAARPVTVVLIFQTGEPIVFEGEPQARLCPSGAVHGCSARPVPLWRTSLRRDFLYVAPNTDMKKPQRDTASPSCASTEARSLT